MCVDGIAFCKSGHIFTAPGVLVLEYQLVSFYIA